METCGLAGVLMGTVWRPGEHPVKVGLFRQRAGVALFNPSSCIKAHESRYFIDGTLPLPGTKCDQDAPPFSTP